MASMNRVILMGNMTRDPELRQTPNGTDVCDSGLAVNRTYRDGEGQRQEDTTFVDLEAWGRTAQVISQYLRKGAPVLIEGRLRQDRWQDQSGQNRSRIKVVIEIFEFIASKGEHTQETGLDVTLTRPAGRQPGPTPNQDRQPNQRPQTAAAR